MLCKKHQRRLLAPTKLPKERDDENKDRDGTSVVYPAVATQIYALANLELLSLCNIFVYRRVFQKNLEKALFFKTRRHLI